MKESIQVQIARNVYKELYNTLVHVAMYTWSRPTLIQCIFLQLYHISIGGDDVIYMEWW